MRVDSVLGYKNLRKFQYQNFFNCLLFFLTHPNIQPPLPVSSAESSGSEMPSGGRPKRIRRPNVRYGSEEYDLSAVSANKKNLILSGLYVKRGRPMDRGRC